VCSELLNLCWDKKPETRPPFIEILASLERIIVEAAISDPVARKFWAADIAQDFVVWDVFWRAFCTFLSYAAPLLPKRCGAQITLTHQASMSDIRIPEADPSDPMHILAKATFGMCITFVTHYAQWLSRSRSRSLSLSLSLCLTHFV
jgi:hypothetical protein